MIQGKKAIASLVELFQARGVHLSHACQLQDLHSYLKVRGIPSRALLTKQELPFTAFDTDQTDRTNRVWDKVFANLVDIGEWFALGRAATPNAYGPILLLIKPRALLQTKSVAVCLRSAGARGFNRKLEALRSVDEVDRLFEYPADTGTPRSALIKDKSFIRRDFNKPSAELPELSISILGQRIPYRYVEAIVVDPYFVKCRSLNYWASKMISGAKLHTPITTRRSASRLLYKELGRFIISSGHGFPNLFLANNLSPQLQGWSKRILDNELDYMYNRYSRYLREGTLSPLIEGKIRFPYRT